MKRVPPYRKRFANAPKHAKRKTPGPGLLDWRALAQPKKARQP